MDKSDDVKVYDSITEALEHEGWVIAEVGAYRVRVGEDTGLKFADDPVRRYIGDGIRLTVANGAMPPHIDKFFDTRAAVGAYLAAGNVLNTTTFRWVADTEFLAMLEQEAPDNQ